MPVTDAEWSELAASHDIIHLGKRCTTAESRNGVAGLGFADGSSAEADVVVGCDGIRSAVRASMSTARCVS